MLRFQFEAQQRGRRVTGRICARTVFGAMQILRLTGMDRIQIRQLDRLDVGQPQA